MAHVLLNRKRGSQSKRIGVLQLCIFLLVCVAFGQSEENEKVYFTTGFKIGEITDHSAILLTRLCRSSRPNPIVHKQKAPPMRVPIDFDDSMPVHKMDGAIEGTFGQVKIDLFSTTDSISSGWNYVSSYKDYTFKTSFENLKSNTEYRVYIFGRKNQDAPITSIQGNFKTVPDSQEIIPVVFTSSTCQYFWDYDNPKRGFKVYDEMMKLKPAFHCQTGDYVYYDKLGPLATSVAKARHKWNAINAWPSLVDFYAKTPLFIQKDDHDVTKDDATPFSEPFGELTWEDGLAVWHEQTPTDEGRPYRSLRYGKDLEVWFVEGRVFRNSDNVEDPSSSIWGTEQKNWFVESVKKSDATFKILMSPTPVVGPDRKNKKDNHANSVYKAEGDWLKDFIATQKHMFVVNGDRHWQYVSKDIRTGVLEFSQGPSSDEHAQGWKEGDKREEHEFLRVKGGFLGVEVDREKEVPKIVFTHYNVDGNAVNTKIIKDE